MKVLILSYYFPPSPTAAAQRIGGWVKYLSREVELTTVVSRFWEGRTTSLEDTISPTEQQTEKQEFIYNGAKLISVPYQPSKRDRMILRNEGRPLIRKFNTLKEITSEFLSTSGSTKFPIFEAARNELTRENYDIIVASGEPFVLFKYASELSHEFKIPWVADFRDAWSENPTGNYNPGIKQLYSYLEKKYSRTASALITVSEPYRSRLLLNQLVPTFVVENSFDPEIKGQFKRPKKFTVTFAGTIYDDPYVEMLIAGIHDVMDWSNRSITFKFIGIDLYSNPGTEKMHQVKSRYPENILIEPRTSQEMFNEEINSTHVLLGLIPGSQSEGIIAAKTYQYLSTPNPIIMLESIRPENFQPVDASITYVYSSNELSSSLKRLYEQWSKGEVTHISRDNRIENHSHSSRVKQLISIFEEII